jgi:hypothetical protein
MKTLVAAVALAVLTAAPALAQTFDRPASNPEAAQTAPRGGQYGVRDSDAVMDKGRMIARDPDPWIRNELLRHSHSGWPD